MKGAILQDFENWNGGFASWRAWEDWAAIHFRAVTSDEQGGKDAFNHMQFLHFVETDEGVKVDMCWAK